MANEIAFEAFTVPVKISSAQKACRSDLQLTRFWEYSADRTALIPERDRMSDAKR